MTELDRWSAPLVAMFEALGMGPRWQRGRRDARAGHVRSLTISTSLVVAQVRGPDEPVAHRARIAVRAFGAAEWARIIDELAAEARYVADLLAGRMPDGIEAVVAGAGLRLLPDSIDQVAMDCTCQQWPMPCAHLAAACHALARSFDTDPFGVLAWRGRGRDELLERLRQLRGSAAVGGGAAGGGAAGVAGGAVDRSGVAGDPADRFGVRHRAAGPGLGDIADFWAEPTDGPPSRAPVAASTTGAQRPDGLLDQLDPPPLSIAGRPLVQLLRPAYQALGD